MKQLCKARKIIVAAIAFIVLAISVFAYNKVFRANVSTSSESAEVKIATVPVVSRQSNLAESKIKNADTVAWLYLPGTEIDEAVVQAKDNEYYLQRTFDKKYDIWGCYFADYINDLSGRDKLSPNTIIYGHAYRNEDPNERKFTQLFKYLDAAFIEQNPYIYLAVDGEDLVFQVCAVFFTDISFDYIDPTPGTEFYATVAAKNEFVFEGLGIGPGDKVLTLSTCSHRYDTKNTRNHRFVVMGKLLPQDAEVQPMEIEINPNPQRP